MPITTGTDRLSRPIRSRGTGCSPEHRLVIFVNQTFNLDTRGFVHENCGSSVLDAGDQLLITRQASSGKGLYAFGSLESGRYLVVQNATTGWTPTTALTVTT